MWQQLRHQTDAILTGIGTVLSDDPLLTDRSGIARRRPLLRVVLDSPPALALGLSWRQSAREMFWCLRRPLTRTRRQELEKLGVRVENIGSSGENALDLSPLSTPGAAGNHQPGWKVGLI